MGQMKPTDVSNPDYFHKVVDCQWACPAHTPVPAYIRHIANGEYSEAYLLNRCLLYTSPSPRDKRQSRMPSSA